MAYSSPKTVSSAQISATVIWDDGSGSGPALFAAGTFRAGPPTKYYGTVLKWNGTDWTPVGGFLNLGNASQPPRITSLAAFDDGSGNGTKTLYIAGQFYVQRAVTVNGVGSVIGEQLAHIAKWDPNFIDQNDAPSPRWVPLGTGIPGTGFDNITNPTVMDMEVFNDGSGEKLYVCGDFREVSPIPGGPNENDGFVSGIARWTGTDWEKVGPNSAGLNEYPICMAVHDPDGDGPLPAALVVGGRFSTSSAGSVAGLVQWDGTTWSSIPNWNASLFVGTQSVSSIASFDEDGAGPNPPTLFVCPGDIVTATGLSTFGQGPKATMRYNATTSTWAPLAPPPYDSGAVQTIAVHNDGTGDALYFGTHLVESIDDPAPYTTTSLTKWNGSTLTPVGGGVHGNVLSLASFTHNQIQGLFVGGRYLNVSDPEIPGFIAEWATPPASSCCIADHNHSGTVTVTDIFSFLSAWFAGNISADANTSGTVTVQDIFFFLSRWFAGC